MYQKNNEQLSIRLLLLSGFIGPSTEIVLDLLSAQMSIPWVGVKISGQGALEHLIE